MDDDAASMADGYMLLSSILVIFCFNVLVSLRVAPTSENEGAVGFVLLGNHVLWTVLFGLGWYWYGKRALWLLLVTPFAFPEVFVFLAYVWMSGGMT